MQGQSNLPTRNTLFLALLFKALPPSPLQALSIYKCDLSATDERGTGYRDSMQSVVSHDPGVGEKENMKLQ